MKLRRFLALGAAAVLLLAVFTADLIRKNMELETGGLSLLRDLAIIGAFALIVFALHVTLGKRAQNPIRRLGLSMIATVAMVMLAAIPALTVQANFDTKNYALLPLDYKALLTATLLAASFGVFAVLVLLMLRDLVMFKRKRSTSRNFRIYIILLLLTALSTLTLKPLESSILTDILYLCAVLIAVVNSFRLSWIAYLTKKEKIITLVYGFFLFIGFSLLNGMLAQSAVVRQSLLYYSFPLRQSILLTCMFANVYFGMAFVSTLFHLPTAEAFDRKATEISSLHNLSRLVTQVFDFNELVETVTSMTLQVCEARSCWLELIHYQDEGYAEGKQSARSPGGYHIETVGMKNITPEEIESLLSAGHRTLRDAVLEERRPVLVDDIRHDPRFSHLSNRQTPFGSLVVVPLLSRSGPVGILYVTKESEFGFFRDDVDVVSAFADQATVAIENSRLIKKSIERERLLREMMLAHEMQRKLLPQSLPKVDALEIDAISTPAFEVGGDYYDLLEIGDGKIGIVVGDVSGKGVSAAFYMSEVKGIFQSLGKLYPSPRDFLIKANEALSGSIDKHSFISLIYVVLDLSSGTLTLSRAGHCPMLHISGGSASYIRPSGMGLGLSRGPTFDRSIEEHRMSLSRGDLCVLYTDGVTEARQGDEEFGYERLKEVVRDCHGMSAASVKEEIIAKVRNHVAQQANDDDLTVVVLKWHGRDRVRNAAQSQVEEVS